MNGKLFAFCICFVIVALLAKVIGCGLVSKLCRYSVPDCLKIGVGGQSKTECYADDGYTSCVWIAVIQCQENLIEKKSTDDRYCKERWCTSLYGFLRRSAMGQ